jgi:uroporphyrinogen-III synthase
VLVTRPEPGASRTAARLAAAGYEPVVLPLTRIAPLAAALPKGPFDAVIVTSAQALNEFDAARILHLPVYAVGGTTAESAESAGFARVLTARGGVASITALVLESAHVRLLYLCGKVRRPDLESAMEKAGLHLTAVETYDAVPASYSDAEIAARLGGAPLAAVALMSARAAELFVPLALKVNFSLLFNSSEIFCFSPRIAESLGEVPIWRVSVSREASEGALMELMSERLLQK